MKKKNKGLWLFGLSGSGKTTLSKKISKNAKQNGIKIINVVTTNKRVNRKLLNKKNVVGKSIIQPKINCKIINV